MGRPLSKSPGIGGVSYGARGLNPPPQILQRNDFSANKNQKTGSTNNRPVRRSCGKPTGASSYYAVTVTFIALCCKPVFKIIKVVVEPACRPKGILICKDETWGGILSAA